MSPRINKYHIRRIIADLEVEHTGDIFTSRYIDNWLEKYPEIIPDPLFGMLNQNDDGTRHITGGARNTVNFRGVGDVTVNLINEMSFGAEYKHFSETELTVDYKGSFIYLAYNECRSDEDDPDISRRFEFNDRTLILKISYFFNI
jgi:hypothetical protein